MTQNFDTDGYLHLPAFFDESELAKLDAFDRLWSMRPPALTVDDLSTGERMLLKDAPAQLRQRPYKLNDLYLESVSFRATFAQPRLAQLLQSLLQKPGPLAIINTLHVERGTEQEFHNDRLYLPGRAPGNMIAVWVALEDVHLDAGPLLYYPGSHLIPEPHPLSTMPVSERVSRTDEIMDYYMREIEARGLRRHDNSYMKRGDVFVWNENLIHSGAPINSLALTRKSIVTHLWVRGDVPGPTVRINDSFYWWQRPHQAVKAKAEGEYRR